jgi:predicted nucleic acid-binding protein
MSARLSHIDGSGSEEMILRILLDTCIYDEIITSPRLSDRIHELIRSERIEIIQPHIIRSQLEAAPESKRKALLSIPVRVIPVDGLLAGYSSAGDRVGSGSGGIRIEEMLKNKKPTPGNTRDALIATTAATETDVFVTKDRRLRNRMKSMSPSTQIWNFTDLESHLANF